MSFKVLQWSKNRQGGAQCSLPSPGQIGWKNKEVKTFSTCNFWEIAAVEPFICISDGNLPSDWEIWENKIQLLPWCQRNDWNETKTSRIVIIEWWDQEIIYSLSNAVEDFESKIKFRRLFFWWRKNLCVLCFSKCSAIFMRNYRRLC